MTCLNSLAMNASGRSLHVIFLKLLILCTLPIPESPAQIAKKRSKRDRTAEEPPKVMSSEQFRQTYLPSFAPKEQSGSYRSPGQHRTRFFGTEATGDTIVFVIDNSTSMHEGGRLERAHGELTRTISQLEWTQKFHVIAFDRQTLELPWGPYVSAGSDKARQVGPWLRSLQQGDDTQPAQALKTALGLKPDCIFFLTDGDFAVPTPEAIRGWNTAGVPVHVIDLNSKVEFAPLKRIAADSRGTYRRP